MIPNSFPRWKKAYNEHRNDSIKIEWKLDEDNNFVVIITYNQIKEN